MGGSSPVVLCLAYTANTLMTTPTSKPRRPVCQNPDFLLRETPQYLTREVRERGGGGGGGRELITTRK